MPEARRRILVLGYGNPGRQDDGLGPEAARRIAALGLDGVTVDSDYQLVVEHAAEAAEHDVVVFVDASVAEEEPFFLRRVEARGEVGFSSHGVQPEQVVGLAGTLFGRAPEAWALGVRGYEFGEFGEGLGARATQNLQTALAVLVPMLESGRFDEPSLTRQSEAHNA